MTKPENIVGIEYNRVTNVSAHDIPGYKLGEDYAWSLEKFEESFQINIQHLTEKEANFDLVNIDTSVANAFRRIMIAEVPSVAPETIFIFNNTSVISDEVLSHRIGLIPLKVDPDLLTWVDSNVEEDEGKFTDENTIVMSLNVSCTRNPDAPKDSQDPNELYRNSNVYSKDLKFEPQGRQLEMFKGNPVEPVFPNILLAKLRPGQEISLTAHCVLGTGSDHAKFSPVATASYRLMPVIQILKDVEGEDAKKFQKCFTPGVIGIDDDGKAFVKDARKDTVSREVLRHDEFKGKVKLGRDRSQFIFNVESVSAMSPEEIFFKSVRILKNKAEYLRNCPIGQV
ncbi:DNA-directed RNA polymerase core subunit [Saccharomycopsis crataegensis]|uniref:DNA-directed RNA polymerases I and III subunit RPAC1 n=1 Tax=Saccharomycopsis crataegensis TaxID=43959 RepID=A0AAV5QPI1_9ASCO|nr:DNA-directed RNA polymerase core subunit [Saccharomycopsis crataegensis]